MLAILEILINIKKFLTGILTSIFSWMREHPKMTLVIILLVLTNLGSSWYSYHWGFDRATTEDTKIIKAKDVLISKYEGDIKERDLKILEVEADSKEDADIATEIIANKIILLNKTKTEFTTKLNQEIAKRNASVSSVTVVSPETKNTVMVTLDRDEVICSRFHDAFLDSINLMVKISNSGTNTIKLENGIKTVPSTVPAENYSPTLLESPRALTD
jgi:hypothetical protein